MGAATADAVGHGALGANLEYAWRGAGVGATPVRVRAAVVAYNEQWMQCVCPHTFASRSPCPAPPRLATLDLRSDARSPARSLARSLARRHTLQIAAGPGGSQAGVVAVHLWQHEACILQRDYESEAPSWSLRARPPPPPIELDGPAPPAPSASSSSSPPPPPLLSPGVGCGECVACTASGAQAPPADGCIMAAANAAFIAEGALGAMLACCECR